MSVAEHNPVLDGSNRPPRKMQDELHLIADALPVMISRIDTGEHYVFNNRAYENWFGLTRKELYGRTVREMLGEETYRQAQPHLHAALAGTEQLFEAIVQSRNGETHKMLVNYVPHFGPLGRVEGVYALVTEVTRYHSAENEIRRMNTDLERRVQERTAQLEASNRELEAFCYSISHDLRAPLRAIRGFTEVLLEQHAPQLDARGQDFLRRVSAASSQMDKLVDDLLRLSRISRSELQRQQINLSALAEEVVSELKREEPQREIETVIAPGLQAPGDERLVRVVLDNLLRNAWKFTGKKARARIEFGRIEAPEPAFFVRDNGVGFDMAYAGRLFGVFQRLHSVTDYPGSGIGLAIVQRVINRHGGRVWAESSENSGATFYFTLPANCDT
jgi:PAS domain S-box-containing protein